MLSSSSSLPLLFDGPFLLRNIRCAMPLKRYNREWLVVLMDTVGVAVVGVDDQGTAVDVDEKKQGCTIKPQDRSNFVIRAIEKSSDHSRIVFAVVVVEVVMDRWDDCFILLLQP